MWKDSLGQERVNELAQRKLCSETNVACDIKEMQGGGIEDEEAMAAFGFQKQCHVPHYITKTSALSRVSPSVIVSRVKF